jgi:hypothetical protein
MFVGAEFPHLGQRAREARQRACAAFGFGALRHLHVMTADDHLDLRQFALNCARDALDQRNTSGRRRIVGAIDSGALDARGGNRLGNVALGNAIGRQLPRRIGLVDQRAADLIAGVNPRGAIDAVPSGGQGSLAFQNSGTDVFRSFLMCLLDCGLSSLRRLFDGGFLRRRLFRYRGFGRRLLSARMHTRPHHRFCYRSG